MNEKELNSIEQIIKRAGEMILSARPRGEEVHRKTGPANFVTDYDVKLQEYLIRSLSGVLPGAQYFGEEETEGNTHGGEEGYVFFIDPIDGTTNFMFDYHNSCVSVGLGRDGTLIAGWVYDPYKDQLYSAVKGQGAYLNGERLYLKDLALNSGICAFGCARYNEGDRIFEILRKLFMHSLAIRNGGSSAIDLCRIASGSNVGYIEMKLQPYDYAAASVILTEAGGVISQADGSGITLDRGCSVIAGTPKAYEEIKELAAGLTDEQQLAFALTDERQLAETGLKE